MLTLLPLHRCKLSYPITWFLPNHRWLSFLVVLDYSNLTDLITVHDNWVKLFIMSNDNLISYSLSILIYIDKFTYRSIFGKVFAKLFLKIIVIPAKHIPQRHLLFFFFQKLCIFAVIFLIWIICEFVISTWQVWALPSFRTLPIRNEETGKGMFWLTAK